jgi:hypothetical protein
LEQGSYGSHKVIGKTYVLKSVYIPEYYLGANAEFLGKSWKN